MSFISYSHQNLPSKLHLLRREALRPDHRIMDITSWGRCSNCRSTGRVISCQSGTMGVLGVTWSHLEFFGIDGTWAMRNRPEIPIPLYCLVFGVVPMCSRASYRNQSRNVFWMAHFIGKMAVMSLFHITQQKRGSFIANWYGFSSDVKQIPKMGHLSTPAFVGKMSKIMANLWIWQRSFRQRLTDEAI